MSLPVLASASVHGTIPTAMATGAHHAHAAGAPPAHGVQAGTRHCPDCLTAVDCALSCFGVAVLPSFAQPVPLSTPTRWIAAADPVLPGVAPPGALDPPRPLSPV